MSAASPRIVRPQDAAGLVLLRRPRRGAPEVLLGRRHARTRFMPGVYVGPGGRLEPRDARPSGFAEAPPQARGRIDAATRRHLLAFARCALRETAEETGLLLGRPCPLGQTPPPAVGWQGFAGAGLAPAFDSLRLIARAITPAGSPIRFHTRFFLADGALARGPLAGDGELEDLRWVAVPALERLPMAEVTALVIAEALRQLQSPGPARLLTWRGARRLRR